MVTIRGLEMLTVHQSMARALNRYILRSADVVCDQGRSCKTGSLCRHQGGWPPPMPVAGRSYDGAATTSLWIGVDLFVMGAVYMYFARSSFQIRHLPYHHCAGSCRRDTTTASWISWMRQTPAPS